MLVLSNCKRLAIIGSEVIKDFNQSNTKCWSGIRDFLRMHYNSPRRDTHFWQNVAKSPLPDSYAEYRQCWQHPTPRFSDIQIYEGAGWQGIFHAINWIFVAAPLGIVTTKADLLEIQRLPQQAHNRINSYFEQQLNMPGSTASVPEGCQ